MEIKILVLCLVTASPVFANGNPNVPPNPYELELDRARSAWNFGGHYARKTPWMINRSSQRISGPVIADRRLGAALPFQPAPPQMPLRQILKSPLQKLPTQYTQQPKPPQNKIPTKSKPRSKSKRPKRTKPSKMISPKFPGFTGLSPRKQPVYNRTSRSQSRSSKGRSSRKIPSSNSRSDTVLNKFRKEDLWHLDKGESYALKTKDIEDDHHFREYGHNLADHEHEHEDEHENEIEEAKKHKHHDEGDHDEPEKENHEPVHHKHIHEHDGDNEVHDEARQKLESEAEKVVAESMKGQPHSSEGKDVQHVHHHHHHHSEHKNATKDAAKKKEEKKPEKNKIIPLPLPRIHNPIPLGCLLTVPVFHPIRPRHQLACLLSIPGTPNLLKRRRRSADPQQKQQQPNMGAHPQSQNQQFYHQNPNQGMSMYSYPPQRKAYANHVGGGKVPIPPPSSPVNSNLKVPATIIPPPKFDKTDILQMLLGSGGVDVGEIGTVLMSNNRYVRYGRGLPNSSARKGRAMWTNRSPVQPRQSIAALAPAQKQQPTIKQYSPKPTLAARNPIVSLTPPVPMSLPSASAPRGQIMQAAPVPNRAPAPVRPTTAFQYNNQQNRNHPQPQFKPVLAPPKAPSPTGIPKPEPQQQQSYYNSDIQTFKYSDWKPFKSQKSKPFRSSPSFTQQHKYNPNPMSMTAESQQHVKSSLSPVATTEADQSTHQSVSLTDYEHEDHIDVSDLAEALGMYKSSASKSKKKAKAKFEKTVKDTVSSPPTYNTDALKSTPLKSYSYAVKNKKVNDNVDFYDEEEDDLSVADSNRLRFSLFNEYGDEEIEVYVPKGKLRFPKVNKIPDPIIVNVPKDNSIDRI